jgi:hypothetical protein
MTNTNRQGEAAMTDDILDDLFHACSLAAYLQQAQIQQGWPDSESTHRRACAYYEQALKTKHLGDRSKLKPDERQLNRSVVPPVP